MGPAYMTQHGLFGSVNSAQGIGIQGFITSVTSYRPSHLSRTTPDSAEAIPNIRSSLSEL